MKKTILSAVLCVALLPLCRLSAQCPQGEVRLTSQAKVNAFGADWPDCDTIHGDLFVGRDSSTTNITNLAALNNIRHIEGSLYVHWNFFMAKLDGLENLQTVKEDVSFSNNRALQNLHALEQLEQVGGSLIFSNNGALTSFDGLALDTVPRHLIIQSCNALTDLTGFHNLQYVGLDLDISNCTGLRNMNGLNALSAVGKNLIIHDNYNLDNLSGLSALDSIHGGFIMGNNSNFLATRMQGIESLKYARSLELHDNFFLEHLRGLEQLTVERRISISHHQGMYDFSGLKMFNNFKGDLLFTDVGFSNLEVLSGITSLASLQLRDNIGLTSLSGLNRLKRIDSLFVLSGNISLVDINALNHDIDYNGETLVIENNFSIPHCAVEAICNWLSRPDEIDALTIFQNGPNCEYPLQVEAACLDEGVSETNVVLWPNPVHGRLNVFANLPYLEVTVRVRNFTGRVLVEDTFERNWHFDADEWIAGVYFVEVEVNGNKLTKRLIKI